MKNEQRIYAILADAARTIEQQREQIERLTLKAEAYDVIARMQPMPAVPRPASVDIVWQIKDTLAVILADQQRARENQHASPSVEKTFDESNREKREQYYAALQNAINRDPFKG